MRSKMVWGSWAQIGFVLGFWTGSVHHKEIGKKQREHDLKIFQKQRRIIYPSRGPPTSRLKRVDKIILELYSSY